MKVLRVLVFVLGVIFCFQSDAGAQSLNEVLTPKQNSVSKVMSNAGCHPGWLSKVLVDSNIKPSNLRRLPVGQKVVMHGSCQSKPEATIVDLSKMINQAQLSESVNQKLARETKALHATNTQLEKKVKDAALVNNGLKSQIDGLSKENKAQATIIAKLSGQNTDTFSLEWLMIVGIIGLLVGGLIASAYWTKKSSRHFHFRREWLVTMDGKTYVFQFVGAGESSPGSTNMVGKYKCPECNERNLYGRETNLRAHIEKAHPQTRIQMDVDDSLKGYA